MNPEDFLAVWQEGNRSREREVSFAPQLAGQEFSMNAQPRGDSSRSPAPGSVWIMSPARPAARSDRRRRANWTRRKRGASGLTGAEVGRRPDIYAIFTHQAGPFTVSGGRPWQDGHEPPTTMLDLVLISMTLGFFILGAIYAHYCETI